MPVQLGNQQRNIENIEITQELYDQQQEQAWDLVNDFAETSASKNKSMVKGAKYDSMNISELRNQLLNDKDSKSESYNLMSEKVDSFLKLAKDKGEYTENGVTLTASFYDTFFQAKEAVNRYIFGHSGHKWFDKGERRLQISLRIKDLLNEMELKLDENQKALFRKEARMQEYKKQGLTDEQIKDNEDLVKANAQAEDIKRIISTGDLGPEIPAEQEQQAMQTWVANDYSQELTKLVEGKPLTTKNDKNKFLAFVEDKNNRILANRMALSLSLDRKRNLTMDMPWVRQEMEDYIKSKLKEEDLLKKPQEYLAIVDNLASSYVTENAERIASYKTRKDVVTRDLNLSPDDTGAFSFRAMKELITETDENAFKDKLAALTKNAKDADEIINERLKQRYSLVTRDSIKKKLYKHLGAFRVFGNTEQVIVQTDMFFEMLAFTAPEEFRVERQLKELMAKTQVEDVHRDSFVSALTKQRPQTFAEHKNSHWKSDAQKVAARIKENTDAANKFFETKVKFVTKQQWEEMEQQVANCAAMKKYELLRILTGIASRPVSRTEKIISRREYTENKVYEDAQKIPMIRQKSRAERKKLDKLGDSLSKKFFVHLAGDGKNIYQPYRALAATYQNTTKEFNAKCKLENQRIEKRKEDVRFALMTRGVSHSEVAGYLEKLKWVMAGLADITEDMSIEQRLYTQRRNLEKFGVKDWKDALDKLKGLGRNLKEYEKLPQVKEAKETYDKGVDELKAFSGGKYKEYIPFILSIPDVYAELLKGPEQFRQYLENTLDQKLSPFIEGCKKAGIFGEGDTGKTKEVTYGAVRKQYAHMYIRSIYEGSLSGDAAFFADQILGFQKKLFSIAPKGGESINSTMAKASEWITAECKKAKLPKDVTRILEFTIPQKLMQKAEKDECLQLLMNPAAVNGYVIMQVETYKNKYERDQKRLDVLSGNLVQYRNAVPFDPAAAKTVGEKIRDAKKKGIKEKRKFLKINDYVLNEVRQCKTLVRVTQKGRKAMTLDQSRVNKMRGRVDRYCDSLELPQILKDALIEHGSVGGILPGFTDTYGSSELLYNHALAMKRMYDLLRKDVPVDGTVVRGMGDEEALMYIVKCYGNPALKASIFDKPHSLKVDELRKKPEYKAFRESYKKLVAFEEKTSEDPSLQQEMDQLSNDLRTMLMTGTGVRDDLNKTITEDLDSADQMKRIGEVIDRSAQYADYCNKVMEVVRPEFIRIYRANIDPQMKKEDNLPQHYIDRQMAALRQYLMPDIIDQMTSFPEFRAETWKMRMEVFKQKEFRTYLENESGTVSNVEENRREQSGFSDIDVNETAFEKILDSQTTVFKGKLNKYNKLDDEQKQLFALALMHLDKSAIGLGAEGTMALTSSATKKAQAEAEIRKELDNYVSGKEYHFRIDYRKAVNKLVNYGLDRFGSAEYALSETAYEKAMQFAKEMSAKKLAFGEKDVERLSDGYSSIFAASTKYGKKQLPKIDALRDKELTVEDVKNKLIKFAQDDKKSVLGQMWKTVKKNTNKKVYQIVTIPTKEIVTLDKTIGRNNRINNAVKRLSGMNETDLKLFVRILQNRTLLDKSCIKKDGEELYADQMQRNALLEALCGDASKVKDVIDGFDDSQSCLQALTTALSFQLRDDKNFSGKPITNDCFADKALKRESMVDWKLIERAFEFYDEVMQKRAFIEATKNSGELIKYSGNKNAIKAHKALKSNFAEKKNFKQENFEAKIKGHAGEDKMEDVDGALAGYYALTDQQKVLFIKALGRRDILDISKKDYNKSFFNIKDRNFVNQADRDQLIDKYIEANKDDNIGLSLEPEEYYRAMESLYTTQVSDDVNLLKEKNVKKVFSAERNFVMNRTTAIDWKLFKRALNFVNRATEELEMSEGNALLYRGAGDLEKNGRMSMNYGFLRRNFHKTGNQWARGLLRVGGNTAKVSLDKNNSLDKVLKIATKTAKSIPGKVGFSKDGALQQGLDSVASYASKQKKDLDGVGKSKENEQKIAYQKLQNKIDDVIKEDKSAKEIMNKVKSFLNDTLIADMGKLGDQFFTEEKSAEPNTDNVVEETTIEAKKDSSYGDIRDTAKKVKKVKKIAGKVTDISGKVIKAVGPEELNNIIDLVDQTVTKATYKFLDEKILGLSAEQRGKEIAELKEAADKYIQEKMEDYIKMMAGKDNYEGYKKLMDRFNTYVKNSQATIQSAMKTVFFVQNAADNVMNIANCAENLRVLSSGKEQSATYKEADKKKLEQAKTDERLDDGQLQKAKNAAQKNQALTDVAGDIANAMQKIGIADSSIKIAMNAARVAGIGFGATTEVIYKCINAGLEFANYAVRIMSDRNALKDYYVNTEAGKKEVQKLKEGFRKAQKDKLLAEFNKQSDPKTATTSIVDMISDAKGYEHTSELVEHTGMNMAQSIVFSASKFNPMMETQLMAITVMSVMGLQDFIGDTSPDTVERLFRAFNMSR